MVAVAPIAVGGAALGYFANGALAWGIHAISPNGSDAEASAFFNPHTASLIVWVLRTSLVLMPLFLLLGFLPGLMAKRAERRRKRRLRQAEQP